MRAAIGGVLVLASCLYLGALDRAPVYIGWDEARFALQGHAIATTGRDLNGHRMPLFFLNTDPLIANNSSRIYWQPVLIYLIAAVLRVAPLSESSARLPIALLAILDVWLVYAIARRLFANPWYAVLGALMLTLTPAHFIFGRMASDYFCPVPFVLAWLWCLVRLLQRDDRWLPAATGLVLGVGLYSYIASWIIMPFFLAVTSAALWLSRKPFRTQVGLGAGFALPLLALVPWLSQHPSMLADTLSGYQVEASARLTQRIALYWDYFNPSYLFFSGGSDPMWATRRAGVFLLAFIVLLPLGVWNIWRRTRSVAGAVVIVGFVFAPVPIILALPEAPSYATARDLLAVPFGTLIAVAGVEWLFGEGGGLGRSVAVLLIVSLPAQFAGFARDYFGDYQNRSAFRMDSANMRDAAAFVMESDRSARVPAVYLSTTLGTGKSVQWKYHLVKHQRIDLWDRTHYVTTQTFDPAQVPSGSLLVIDAGNPGTPAMIDRGQCAIAHVVTGAGEVPTALILRRR